jgi:hypothetical protein
MSLALTLRPSGVPPFSGHQAAIEQRVDYRRFVSAVSASEPGSNRHTRRGSLPASTASSSARGEQPGYPGLVEGATSTSRHLLRPAVLAPHGFRSRRATVRQPARGTSVHPLRPLSTLPQLPIRFPWHPSRVTLFVAVFWQPIDASIGWSLSPGVTRESPRLSGVPGDFKAAFVLTTARKSDPHSGLAPSQGFSILPCQPLWGQLWGSLKILSRVSHRGSLCVFSAGPEFLFPALDAYTLRSWPRTRHRVVVGFSPLRVPPRRP